MNWRTVLEGSIPVIAGCTASGKTASALQLASMFPDIEIVSADSRQFYRGMDIGTAKPLKRELDLVPHHMIDVAEPDSLLSAGWYAVAAMEVIENILRRGRIPLVVGGSALYIMCLAGLMDDLPRRNDGIREALETIEEQTPGALHRILSGLDSTEAGRIGPSDRVRLVRSIEIALQSGRLPSELKKGGEHDPRFRFAVLEAGNAELRERIEVRTGAMMDSGLVDEVSGLLERGVPEEPVLADTIGYFEVIDHLRGRCNLEEAARRISVNTWRYARRQRNMFRRLPGAVRVPGDPDRLAEVLFGERISNG